MPLTLKSVVLLFTPFLARYVAPVVSFGENAIEATLYPATLGVPVDVSVNWVP